MKITSQHFAAGAAIVTAAITLLIWKRGAATITVDDSGNSPMVAAGDMQPAGFSGVAPIELSPIDLGDVNIGGNTTEVGDNGGGSCGCEKSCPAPTPFISPINFYPQTTLPIQQQAQMVQTANVSSSPRWQSSPETAAYDAALAASRYGG